MAFSCTPGSEERNEENDDAEDTIGSGRLSIVDVDAILDFVVGTPQIEVKGGCVGRARNAKSIISSLLLACGAKNKSHKGLSQKGSDCVYVPI